MCKHLHTRKVGQQKPASLVMNHRNRAQNKSIWNMATAKQQIILRYDEASALPSYQQLDGFWLLQYPSPTMLLIAVMISARIVITVVYSHIFHWQCLKNSSSMLGVSFTLSFKEQSNIIRLDNKGPLLSSQKTRWNLINKYIITQYFLKSFFHLLP